MSACGQAISAVKMAYLTVVMMRFEFGELVTFDVDQGIDDEAWARARPRKVPPAGYEQFDLFGDAS